jgi:hypothetical protein
MEGNLKMYLGILSRWQTKYFILHEEVLSFCDTRGSKIQGNMHLGLASVQSELDDLLVITISNGVSELKLAAENLPDKLKWVSAFTRVQQNYQQNAIRNSLFSNGEQGQFSGKNLFKLEPEIRKLLHSKESTFANDKLTDVWLLQAQLKHNLFNLEMRFPEESEEYQICENMGKISDD